MAAAGTQVTVVSSLATGVDIIRHRRLTTSPAAEPTTALVEEVARSMTPTAWR